MAYQTDAEKRAEQFIEQIKSLLRTTDGLIYGVETAINKPNVISPNTIGDRDGWVEVTLYNVTHPDEAFDSRKWLRLGEIGADVHTHRGDSWNDHRPTIEFHKRFSA